MFVLTGVKSVILSMRIKTFSQLYLHVFSNVNMLKNKKKYWIPITTKLKCSLPIQIVLFTLLLFCI